MSANYIRMAAVSAVLVFATALSGCSGLTPAYGEHSAARSMAFNYDEPKTRLEQVITNELQASFVYTQDVGAPVIRITASPGGGYVQKASAVGVSTTINNSVYVDATASVTNEGQIVFTATRRGTAQYTTGSGNNNQVIASDSAAKEAVERAARDAAASLRLTLLAQFPQMAYRKMK